ncbi:uncharacterized protein LOC131944875 [Physella acuta]|uniref:uncharacterized protein LOC131944875 n=1 Tax=Physella acuta TaxID=109671 RepID=UPI0027DB683D|nr:uncharacterized protein LOC131944875 [Physella acuta]
MAWITLAAIVSLFSLVASLNSTETYTCLDTEQCKTETNPSFSIINGVVLCCRSGDSISIGSLSFSDGSAIGRRSLSCVCRVVDKALSAQLLQVGANVTSYVGEVMTSVGDMLKNLETQLGHLFN